jgi:membrane-bound lytic murein transglycosylase D
MMVAAERNPRGPRRKCVRLQFLLLVTCALCLSAPAQTNQPAELDLGEMLAAAQEWAEDNLDENVLAALGSLDQQKVEQFLALLQKQFGGDSVLDVAALKDAAKSVLPLLDAHVETQPYAAWLRSRLDYMEAAEQLRQLMPPPPKPVPGQPPKPATNPPPALERRVWEHQLSRRPLPKGAEALVPKLKQVFAAERVPTELVWLAEVESSFDRRARSPVGAAGLFQLMPATAKRFGLRRWPFDQRYQVEPSAQATAQYLRALHGRFRDWPLALAAYNYGEGNVGKLLERHKARSFDAIAPHLPAETQMYVPRVEATILRREGLRLGKLPAPAVRQANG